MKIVKYLLKPITVTARGQQGVTLLETLTALALLGIFGVVFLTAISTSSITMANTEKMVNINNLARAQMEYTKNCDYITYDYGALPGNPADDVPPDYTTLDELGPSAPYAISVPSGYAIDVAAVALHEPDDGIQEITVTISRYGENLLVVKGYKVNR